MFIAVTGEPGSGKSAYAVDYVLRNKDIYRNIYLNINGFKMHDNINPLNFPKLLEMLSSCKDIYDSQISELGNVSNDNVIDEPIKNYLIEVGFLELNPKYNDYLLDIEKRRSLSFFHRLYLNLFNAIPVVSEYLPTLIVIDEVQNHMGAIDPVTGKELRTADPMLTWWVSYHRHLYMDVLILSQQYQKIHIAYRRDVSHFIDGIESQSLLLGKFSPNFVYNKYKESPYSKKVKSGMVKVKKRKELFSAYQSGDAVRTKSIILPWVVFSVVLLFLLLTIFYFVVSSFSSVDDNEIVPSSLGSSSNKDKVSASPIVSKYVVEDLSLDSKEYLVLTCISTSCENKTHKINLHIGDLDDLLKNTQSKYLRSKKLSKNMAKVYLLVSPTFLGLFKKQGAIDEKKGFNIIN